MKPKHCVTQLTNECVLLGRVTLAHVNAESWRVYHHIEKSASFETSSKHY